MTQRQITHREGLPPCARGHAARHILDSRRPSAGGGHLIECQCHATIKYAEFDDALEQWCRDNGHAVPNRAPQRRLPLGNVFHLGATR